MTSSREKKNLNSKWQSTAGSKFYMTEIFFFFIGNTGYMHLTYQNLQQPATVGYLNSQMSEGCKIFYSSDQGPELLIRIMQVLNDC